MDFKEDAKFMLGFKPAKAAAALMLVGSVCIGSHVWNFPALRHPDGMELKAAMRYTVDAKPFGADGVRYRSQPRETYTVGIPYPGNGAVIIGKESVQHPGWILADNGYWLPLSVAGQECIKPVRKATAASA